MNRGDSCATTQINSTSRMTNTGPKIQTTHKKNTGAECVRLTP